MTPTPAPYLSVVESEDGPVLLLTIEPDAIVVCEQCPYSHIRLLDDAATPDTLRRFATSIRRWADRLEGVQ